MISGIFEKILQLSLIGTYSIIIVILCRFLLHKCERRFSYFLWFVVFFNLCIPISIQCDYSLIPQKLTEMAKSPVMSEVIREDDLNDTEIILSNTTNIILEEADNIISSTDIDNITPDLKSDPVLNDSGREMINPVLEQELLSDKNSVDLDNYLTSMHPTSRHHLIRILPYIWSIITIFILAWNLLVYIKLKNNLSNKSKINMSVQRRPSVYKSQGIYAPFIIGLIHPIIYLPDNIADNELPYILAHENYHYKRKDHICKLLTFIVVAIHWFNPFVWLTYALFITDMEISCDEAVLAKQEHNSNTSEEIKKRYAESLLKYAAKQNQYLISPLTFGEPSLKSRILNVLNYKKQRIWVSIFAFLLVAAIITGLFIRPSENINDSTEIVSKITENIDENSNVLNSDEVSTDTKETMKNKNNENINEKSEDSEVKTDYREVMTVWNSGTAKGESGSNKFTEYLLTHIDDPEFFRQMLPYDGESDAVTLSTERYADINKEPVDFVTFSYQYRDIYESAVVVSGVEEDNMIQGDIWFVVDDFTIVLLAENVQFQMNQVEYLENMLTYCLVFNYFRGNALEGRAIVYDDSTPFELLPEYYGEKHVSEGGIMEVLHTSYDCCADKISSPDPSSNTEEQYIWTGRSMKPYYFTITSSIYGELSVIELPAEIMSEKYIETKVYGKSLLQQVNEAYPEGERQYIKRKNGDINVNICIENEDSANFYYMTFRTVDGREEAELIENSAGIYLYQLSDAQGIQNF